MFRYGITVRTLTGLVSSFLFMCSSISTMAKNTEEQDIYRGQEFPTCRNTPCLWPDRREECTKSREEECGTETITRASLTSQSSTACTLCLHTRAEGSGIFPEQVSLNETMLDSGPHENPVPAMSSVTSPEGWPWLTLWVQTSNSKKVKIELKIWPKEYLGCPGFIQ